MEIRVEQVANIAWQVSGGEEVSCFARLEDAVLDAARRYRTLGWARIVVEPPTNPRTLASTPDDAPEQA